MEVAVRILRNLKINRLNCPVGRDISLLEIH
jgi:hypothetical protein